MGVLTASGMTNGAGGNDPPDAGGDTEAPDTGEDQREPTEPQPEAAKSEFIPLSKLEQKTPGSRRNKTEQQIEQRFKQFEDNWGKERDQYNQKISAQEQRIAQLVGNIETLQRIPQQQPQAAPAPQGPDPDELYRQADVALDAGNYADHKRLTRQAVQIETQRLVESRVSAVQQQIQQQIPQQLDPFLQHMIATHENVAMNGQRGIRAVMVKDQELDLYGMPAGAERTKKAFELANQMLKKQQPTAPSYSRESASALAGVPTGRPAAAGGSEEQGISLTPLQIETAKNAGMSKEEYARWLQPERFGRR